MQKEIRAPSEAAAEDCTEIQREVAKQVREMILANLEKRYTIAEISHDVHVSPTQVKSSFRKVYGIPVYSFARKCRMQLAARLLVETDGSVMEIAGRIGYENSSKFAKAFRAVMGAPPGEYRRKVCQEADTGCAADIRKTS